MDSLLQSVGAGTDAEEEQFSEALVYVPPPLPPLPPPQPPVARKPKKKSSSNSNNVWTKPTSRKKPKKNKSSSNATTPTPNNINNHPTGTSSASATNNKNPSPDHHSSSVLITPVPRFPDKSDDSPLSPILLSRFHKAERVDLSDDRLTAGSTKGYRMVRATRGVLSGSWYFEIRVLHLGPTGHVRLGWVMDKGDLQAPVGYDRYGYGYRDMDGSKVHRALREPYGEGGYGEGDVVGFYVNLPEGDKYAPKMPQLVWYKGQRYMYSSYATTPGADGKDESPNVVPGSEISFFKNGACQGVAFKELVGGRYYPAASMYTLPNQPNCEVRFNFGPNFEAFPQDFGGRPIPRPMSEVPYHGNDVKAEEAPPMENGFHEKII